MAWNPEVNRHGDGPPPPIDPVELLRSYLGGGGKKPLGLLLLVVLVVVGVLTSYYQVEPDGVGVIRRLGKHVGTSDPGPHFRLPFGIDRVDKVPVQRQLKMEFGFRTAVAGGPRTTTYQGRRDDVTRESLMLTGDLNVAVVEWIVQYKIKDPYAYLFQVRNVEETLRSLSEAAMRSVVGDHSVNEVLTTGRQQVATEAKEALQALADRYGTGADIQQVVLQDVNPPDPVKPSFNEVNQAIQEKERAINEAQADLNKAIPRARGEAEETLRSAEGYAIERVNRARGEAARFLSVYEEYRKNPDVTRRRLYLETIAEILPRAGQKVVIDDSVRGLTPLLNMERSTQPAAATAAAAKEATP